MREFYAQRLGSERLEPTAAINILVTPSHWITSVNVRADRATGDIPSTDLSRALRRHFAFAPAGKYLDHYQMVPKVLLGWLRERASEASEIYNQDAYGEAWKSGRGLRMDWLVARQQRHAQQHRMHTLPTMEVMARRAAHYRQTVSPECMLCGAAVETVGHGWTCRATEWVARANRQRLVDWLDRHVYRGREGPKSLKEAVYDPKAQEIWASGTATAEMKQDHLSIAARGSMGTQFLREAIQASMDLWSHRFKQREAALRAHHGSDMTLKKWIQHLKQQGRREVENGEETPPESDTEEEDIDDEWEDQLRPGAPEVERACEEDDTSDQGEP
jgi:hypothetical protein